MSEYYHELRYLETSTANNSMFSLYDDPGDRLTLIDLIDENDRIVVLGNPGIGKTTELIKVFDLLWEKIEETEMLPIFINIRNFRQTSTIESMIHSEEWKDMPSIIFILDGLDEIGNIQDFTSELENFMSKYSDLKLKFIVSCRTNIYQKYAINISGFIAVYLKNLSHFQIYNILQKKYNIDTSNIDLYKFSAILQTPFNLDLFAEYYEQKGNFPGNLQDALQLFIEKEIEKTLPMIMNHGFQLTKPEIFHALKEVAVVNEMMQQNAITEEHLYRLLKSRGLAIFQELPFIEKPLSADNYVFRHKNYQEYFAASYIATLSIEKIIEFITVKDVNKIQPSLFNTITFLLNIIDKTKVRALKDWLLKHDKELLFFAEEDRLDPDFQNTLFEMYFKEVCIEKTFWISNNGKIAMDVLASFANFKFLLDEMTNKTRHPRARSSALEVLSYKHLTSDQIDLLKVQLQVILQTKEDILRNQVLRTIKAQKFYVDEAFFRPILELFKDTSDRNDLHQIISILVSMDDKERNSEVLLHFVKHFYSTTDNVIRGTENLIASVILNTSDWKLNLSLLELLFDDGYSIRPNSIYFDNFEVQLIRKSKEFSAEDDYIQRLLEMSFSEKYRIVSNQVLKDMLTEIGIKPELVIHILQKEGVSRDALYSISNFLNQDSIDAIVENYICRNLKFNSEDDIDSLRNWLSNVDLDLSLYLQTKFENTGHQFAVSLQTQEAFEIKKKEYADFQLSNFNLLFDKTQIIEKTREYFKENEVETLTKQQFQKLFWEWYEKFNYHGLQYTIHTILETVLRSNYNVTPDIVAEALEDPYIYLSAIKTSLAHHSSRNLPLTQDQLSIIEILSKNIRSKIDFDNVIKFNADDPDIFHTTLYFEYINIVLFFDFSYGIEQEPDFYLNSLEFGNISGSNKTEENSFVLHVSKKVKDKSELQKRVIKNILKGNLIYIAKRDHYDYAVNHNLFETYDKIGEDIKTDGASLDQNNFIEKYVSKLANPLEFLKECSSDHIAYFSWRIIKLIKEKYFDKHYIRNFALSYLETQDINFIDDAVDILFYLNEENALQHYYKALVKIIEVTPDTSGFLPKDLKNYNKLSELLLFETLFNVIYDENIVNSFYLHYSRSFFSILTAQLSETDEGYYLLQDILNSIKNKTETDLQTFHINSLIDTANDSRLKSKSKKLSFQEAYAVIKGLN